MEETQVNKRSFRSFMDSLSNTIKSSMSAIYDNKDLTFGFVKSGSCIYCEIENFGNREEARELVTAFNKEALEEVLGLVQKIKEEADRPAREGETRKIMLEFKENRDKVSVYSNTLPVTSCMKYMSSE